MKRTLSAAVAAFLVTLWVVPPAVAEVDDELAEAAALDCDFQGTASSEIITGTAGPDVLCGGGGNDRIIGLGGDDILRGEDGDDILIGGDGDDILIGGSGDDELHGEGGGNTLDGGAGIDQAVARGTEGNDTIEIGDQILEIGTTVSFWTGIEEITLESLGGDDLIDIAPDPVTKFEIDGGSQLALDRLVYRTEGVTGVQVQPGSIFASGRGEVLFTDIELVRAGDSYVLGSPGRDDVSIPEVGPAGLTVNLLDGSDRLEILLAGLAGDVKVADTGTTGRDVLVLRDSDGNRAVTLNELGFRVGLHDIGTGGIEFVEYLGQKGDDELVVDLDRLPADQDVIFTGGEGIDRVTVRAGDLAAVLDPTGDTVSVGSRARVQLLDVESARVESSTTGTRTISSAGYWVLDETGAVHAFGDAPFVGDLAGGVAGSSARALVPTPSGDGYWLVSAAGGVFGFGDAKSYGDVSDLHLNRPIVHAVRTRSGDGYFLLGADGGVFALGDAVFKGSTGSIDLVRPVVAMATDPSGDGYWFVASDGGVFAYDAGYFGSVPGEGITPDMLVAPIVGMAPTATGQGYWLVAADGGVFAFGDAEFHGSLPALLPQGPAAPITAIVATASGDGYWLIGEDGGVFGFGAANFVGSAAGTTSARVVAAAPRA